jgi:Peptidase family C25
MAQLFATSCDRLRPRLLLILALGTALATACAPVTKGSGAAGTQGAVKIVVDADGAYEVPASALREADFDLTGANPQNLMLTAGGQPVPFQLVGQGRDRALQFYGQGLGPSSYDGRNIYWLSAKPSSEASNAVGSTIPARPATPTPELNPSRVVSSTIHVEEQRQYLSQVSRDADRWFWQPLFAPSETEIQLAARHTAPGAGQLRLRVWGNSSAPANPDHHLLLYLNGTMVADSAWDGMGAHVITAAVPSGTLREGDNRLTLKAPGDTGAKADSLLVDWVEISYPRELVVDDTLLFNSQAPGFTVRIPAGAASNSLVLWDVTDPARPTALTGYKVEGDQLTFASDNTLRRFLVTTRAGLNQPLSIAPATSPDLRDWPGGADLIIVTVPQFREALEPLVAARRAAGLRVALVDVSAVYDTFNNGRADPAAIRALIQHARAHWMPPAPRFLLLAGDASYDPHGYLKGAETDLIPTQLVDTTFTGWTASDVWYALPEENVETGEAVALKPVLAVGRFPAQTVEQMNAMVTKTLAYQREQVGAPWNRSTLLLVDNEDPAFALVAQRFEDAIRRKYVPEVVALTGDGSQARARLLQALDEGVGLLGYFGHGSMTLWAQEKIFGVDDVSGLDNRNRLPIVFTVTCLSGLFNHPATTSLGEALLRAKDGGAVAALVPSSAGATPDQRFLVDGLAASLAKLQTPAGANGATLGEAIQRAQIGLPKGIPGAREMGLTFNLLGDPSLILER